MLIKNNMEKEAYRGVALAIVFREGLSGDLKIRSQLWEKLVEGQSKEIIE